MFHRISTGMPVAFIVLAALMMMPPGGGNGKGKPKNPPAVEFFVDATAGDDNGDGNAAAPFATLERAQTAARQATVDQAADIVVSLVGIHPRNSTFRLTAADSGKNGFDVVYRSAPGSQAMVEGGVELNGWQHAGGGLYAVDVPAGVADFRQFYAASARQQRARSATASGVGSEFIQETVNGSTHNVAMVVSNDVIAGLAHPEDLELLYVGVLISGHGILNASGNELFRPSWRSHRLQVSTVATFDADHSRIDIEADALWHASQRGYFTTFLAPQDPFYLENALELLDEEGEWFFDPRIRKLYWWPADGVDPNTIDTWIPTVETLLDLDGTPAAPVHHLRIENLVFRHSTYLKTSETGYVSGQGPAWFVGWEPDDWMVDNNVSHSYLARGAPQGLPGAAVEMDSAHDVHFTGNVLTELGAAGVLLHNDVTDAEFARNVFDDISGSALIGGHEEHVFIDEPMERLIQRITIENNLVTRVGREYFTGVGIRIFKAADVSISHNHFVDLPYSAISLGWGHNNFPDSDVNRRNSVINNHFENVVNTLYDGSAIYLLGPAAVVGAPTGEGTTVTGNFVDYSSAAIPLKLPGDTVNAAYVKRPGLQLDEGTINVAIDKNVTIDPSIWFQLTAWTSQNGDPDYVAGLGLSGSNNWSNVSSSLPTNLSLINMAAVKSFNPDSKWPKPLERITNKAGIESGVTLPTVP